MERWHGKIAVITGASSGIGYCITKTLLNNGMIVIGLARRLEILENLQKEFALTTNDNSSNNNNFHYYFCDVTDVDSVRIAFEWIEKNFHKIHVLINNAGVFKYTGILKSNNENDLKSIIDTNFMGAIYCAKQTYKIMKETNEECHIVNMNSILGHVIPVGKFSSTYNVYPSSKFALRTASEVLRQELLNELNFRITNLSPGLVRTDISQKAGHPAASRIMTTNAILNPEDIANAIVFVLSVPRHVQISEMVIIPVGQKF